MTDIVRWILTFVAAAFGGYGMGRYMAWRASQEGKGGE